jgi:superfamily II DNA/RNA helicase
MLDMGFIPDIERIVAMLPRTRQTLFFSATMAPEIRRLADAFLQNPKEITVSKPASVATTITAGLALVAQHDKREALRRLIRSEDVQNALIFCNRKRDVDILLKSLTKHHFDAGALHGDLAQSVRFATLEKFKAGDIRLLVCSDVAARGIDIGGLSHVFNFDVPHHAEDYVHRIGRTGRAGRDGKAFTIAAPEDRLAVEAIEKLIAAPIPRIEIPGLDAVEWAEDDGRRGRGRGRSKPAAKAPARAPKFREDEPRAAEPRAAEPRAAESRPARAKPAPKDRAPRRSEEPRAPRDDSARFPRDEGNRSEPIAEAPRRDEYRRRDNRAPDRNQDNGPNVIGFGAEVPAFMLIRKRPAKPDEPEIFSEVEEDLPDEENGNSEIAA